jgi:hypothetical protein
MFLMGKRISSIVIVFSGSPISPLGCAWSAYLFDLGQMANLKLVDKRGKELVELKLQVLA